MSNHPRPLAPIGTRNPTSSGVEGRGAAGGGGGGANAPNNNMQFRSITDHPASANIPSIQGAPLHEPQGLLGSFLPELDSHWRNPPTTNMERPLERPNDLMAAATGYMPPLPNFESSLSAGNAPFSQTVPSNSRNADALLADRMAASENQTLLLQELVARMMSSRNLWPRPPGTYANMSELDSLRAGLAFGDVATAVEVPSSEHVAEIVGRQGCKIKALRSKTDTYIKTPVRGEDPIFFITGKPVNVQIAREEIESAANHFTQIRATRRHNLAGSHAPGHVTIYVRVPLRVVGLVVGPKGGTIKRIQQDTNTYIITPSRDREPVFEVTGLPPNAEAARSEIEQHIFHRTGNFPITNPNASITEFNLQQQLSIQAPVRRSSLSYGALAPASQPPSSGGAVAAELRRGSYITNNYGSLDCFPGAAVASGMLPRFPAQGFGVASSSVNGSMTPMSYNSQQSSTDQSPEALTQPESAPMWSNLNSFFTANGDFFPLDFSASAIPFTYHRTDNAQSAAPQPQSLHLSLDARGPRSAQAPQPSGAGASENGQRLYELQAQASRQAQDNGFVGIAQPEPLRIDFYPELRTYWNDDSSTNAQSTENAAGSAHNSNGNI